MKIIISGYGKMGSLLLERLKDNHELSVVDLKLGNSITDIKEEADVIIDFSNRESIYSIAKYIENKKTKLIIGTTGYLDTEEEIISKLSEDHVVIKSSNFSKGIYIMNELVSTLNKFDLSEAFIRLIEKHNKNKIDSPSGTSKSLMSKLSFPIDVTSVRSGDIIGEHELELVLGSEVINIKHTAYSRNVFIDGVIELLGIIDELEDGLYSLERINKWKEKKLLI